MEVSQSLGSCLALLPRTGHGQSSGTRHCSRNWDFQCLGIKLRIILWHKQWPSQSGHGERSYCCIRNPSGPAPVALTGTEPSRCVLRAGQEPGGGSFMCHTDLHFRPQETKGRKKQNIPILWWRHTLQVTGILFSCSESSVFAPL